MRILHRTIGSAIALAAVLLSSGCSTPGKDAAVGGVVGLVAGTVIGTALGNRETGAETGAAIGTVSGIAIGAAIGEINKRQREKLEANSPQTLRKIEHNDHVVAYQLEMSEANNGEHSLVGPSSAVTSIPLSADDVKALTAADVKDRAIIRAIAESNAIYRSSEIARLKRQNPQVRPAVISYMEETAKNRCRPFLGGGVIGFEIGRPSTSGSNWGNSIDEVPDPTEINNGKAKK